MAFIYKLELEDGTSAVSGWADRRDPFAVAIRLLDRERKRQTETSPLRIPPSGLLAAEGDPHEERAIVIVGQLSGVRFDAPGVYRLQLLLNGDVIDERSIVVAQAAGDASTAGTAG